MGLLRRGGGYDLVFDMQGLGRSGLFVWATGASRRVGFSDARELGWLGYTERHEVGVEMNSVDRMLELLRRAGVPPAVDLRLYSPGPDRVAGTGRPASGRPEVRSDGPD